MSTGPFRVPGHTPVAGAGEGTPGKGPITRLLQGSICLYKMMTANRSPACRFTPSCSEFAFEAIGRYGARLALPLVAKRLVRCRPGGPFGFDPVPDLLEPRRSRTIAPSTLRGPQRKRTRESSQ